MVPQPRERCGSRPAVHIEAVLAADCLTTAQGGTATEIAGRMRAIEIQRCLKELQSAYLARIHAWDKAAEVQQAIVVYEQQNGVVGVMMESFVRGLLGDPFGKFNKLSSAAQNMNT